MPQIKVRGILFDLWNTLVYNVPQHSRHDFERIAERIGYPAEQILSRWSGFNVQALRGEIKSGEERARKVLGELGASLELAPEIAQYEYDNRSADVFFFEGVENLLGTLRERGYQTCLVSNCTYLTRSVVERLDLPNLLDAVVLSCEVGYVKPEPQIYQAGAERIGLRVQDCLFVGDGGDYEMDGAKDVGCQVVLLNHERSHAIRYPSKAYPHDLVLGDVRGLLELLP